MYSNNQKNQFILPLDSTYNNGTFPYDKNCECDKLFHNNNSISKINKAVFMNNHDGNQSETMQNSIQLILEFPEKSNDEEYIKHEIKQILSNILLEYLEKIS